MLVLFCLPENGKYDVTRKGKPSSTALFSSLLSAWVGGWSSVATGTLAITARVPLSWSLSCSPRTRQAPMLIIQLASPERTARAEPRKR